MPRKYKVPEGFGYVRLHDAALEQWRTGGSAANPAEAQALVRRIDQLMEKIADVEGDLLVAYSRPSD